MSLPFGFRFSPNFFPTMLALVLTVSLLKVSLLVAGLAVVGWMVYEVVVAPLIEDYEDERDR